MGFGDDILKLSQGFKQSMQGLAQQKAFDEAQERFRQIGKQTKSDPLLGRQEKKELSKQLQQTLLSKGASARQAATAASSFAPQPATKASTDIRAGIDALSQAETQEQRESAQERLQKGKRKKIAQNFISIRKREKERQQEIIKDLKERRKNLSKEQRNRLDEVPKQFRQKNKSALEARDAVNRITDFLTKPKGEDVDFGPFNNAIKALAKTVESGRLTDKDFERAMINRDAISATDRKIQQVLTGDARIEDVEELKKIGEAIKVKAERELFKKTEKFAEEKSKIIPGTDKETVQKQLTGTLSIPEPETLEDKLVEKMQQAGMPQKKIRGVRAALKTPKAEDSQKLLIDAARKTGIDPGRLPGIETKQEGSGAFGLGVF